MKEYSVLPYILWNSALMSNMSISALATIILMRTLSVVPSPWQQIERDCLHCAWLGLCLFLTTDGVITSVCSSYSITGMKYLPSLICITALQRTLACSLCISLESRKRCQRMSCSVFTAWTDITRRYKLRVIKRRWTNTKEVLQQREFTNDCSLKNDYRLKSTRLWCFTTLDARLLYTTQTEKVFSFLDFVCFCT